MNLLNYFFFLLENIHVFVQTTSNYVAKIKSYICNINATEAKLRWRRELIEHITDKMI